MKYQQFMKVPLGGFRGKKTFFDWTHQCNPLCQIKGKTTFLV